MIFNGFSIFLWKIDENCENQCKTTLRDGARRLRDACATVRDGARRLRDGARRLRDGARRLRDACATLRASKMENAQKIRKTVKIMKKYGKS